MIEPINYIIYSISFGFGIYISSSYYRGYIRNISDTSRPIIVDGDKYYISRKRRL